MAPPVVSYRIWFIKTIAKLLVPPVATVWAAIRVADWMDAYKPTTLQAIGLYGLCVPLAIIVGQRISSIKGDRLARKLGVRSIPRLEGKKIGNLDLLDRFVRGRTSGYVGDAFDSMFDEVGSDTIRVSILWTDRILTRDPEFVKGVLATKFTSFGKGIMSKVRTGPFFGHGIFSSDGEMWKLHRSLARPYFARDRISDYQSFHKYSAKLISILTSLAENNTACDVQDLFARFTLDTAGEFLFGSSDLNTLDLPLPEPGKAEMGPKGSMIDGVYGGFAKAFEDLQEIVAMRGFSVPFVWIPQQFIKDPQEEPMHVINEWIKPLVKKAIEARDAINREGTKKNDVLEERSFLDHLAIETDDYAVMRDQLVNMLIAARDTTATLLSFTVYALSMYPEVMDKLRNEVIEKVGTTEAPTYEQMAQLKYLRAVLNETLRLFPPVPLNLRTSLEDEIIVPVTKNQNESYLVPEAGTVVLWSVVSYQRRKDLWGDDADVFDPERWIDDRRHKIVQSPFMFMPFHAGPRICIGQQFAYNEASFVIIRLLQTFDSFKLVQKEAAPLGSVPPESWQGATGRKGMEKVWPQPAITLFAKGGLWVKLNLANND